MTTQIPNMLRIVDGELICKDGSDVKEYLRKYSEDTGITPDTPIILVQQSWYSALVDAYYTSVV